MGSTLDCEANMRSVEFYKVFCLLLVILVLAGCGRQEDTAAQEAPPPATVVPTLDSNSFSVEHPEQYPLAAATPHEAASQLVVTGTVNPDIARTVPVITLASGRIVDIRARLGDTVQKGQLLLRIRSDDVSAGYDGYRKALSDEMLARKQLDRAKDLYDHGAIAMQDLEVAQTADDDAKVTLETTAEHLRLLGNDPDHPGGLVDIFAPISGVITDQEVTNAASIQSYSANPFTISDLSYVWIVCDVYENDIAHLQVGETADIRFNAFPGQVLKGAISNIGAILDPSIRTAKVCVSYILWLAEGDAHGHSSFSNLASSRPRLGLFADARPEVSQARGLRGRNASEPDAGNPFGIAAQPARRHQRAGVAECDRQ
jgi:cobalt-zinc-cadmium efflux system membrane fusion protein